MRFARFQLTYRAEQALELPQYKAGTFRGTFGHIFKRISCPDSHHHNGDNATENINCPYARFFLAKSPSNSPIPPPYVIEDLTVDKQLYKAGEEFSLGLILIGDAIEYTPNFLYAFEKFGSQGIGKGQKRVSLVEVQNISGRDNESIQFLKKRTGEVDMEKGVLFTAFEDIQPRVASQMTVKTYSPVNLQHRGKPVLGAIPFSLLIKNIERRVKLLSWYCSDSDDTVLNLPGRESVTEVSIKDYQMDWTTVKHWSNRQEKYNSLSGLQGWVTYQGNLTPWTPLLILGEKLHIGKKTSFGLGQYQLEIKNG